jgi:DNA-binding XRE family transcriptional regulator
MIADNTPLKACREAWALTQAEMAAQLGMGLSAYQDLETGLSSFKGRHQLALERVSLKLAVERRDLNLALPAARRDALDFAALARGERAAAGSSPSP